MTLGLLQFLGSSSPSKSTFSLFYPFFSFGSHFGMKKVLLTYVFLIFFQNPLEVSLKMKLCIIFSLNSGKNIFLQHEAEQFPKKNQKTKKI